jgi:membrane protein DedA with SNARE-associated domain
MIRPDLIKDFIAWIEIIINNLWYWNYLIIFLSGLIEGFPVLWVVVPGQNILMIVAGFFGKISTMNLIYSIVIASFWAILSNGIWYILWKAYWKSFFEKYWLWFGIWETEVKYLEKWIKKWWATWIIVWKFHNLARAFVPFIAWTMNMDKKTFWIYNIIWSILRAFAIVILWVFFAEYYETIIDYIWYIMTWILVLIWLYIWKFKKQEFLKYMQEKNEEMERKIWK